MHLPVITEEVISSLDAEGRRRTVHPADVKGRFHTLRHVVFAALIIFLLGIPWIRIGHHPAIFLDVDHRLFFLFGQTFNAQDFWLVFFLLTGIGFGLFVVTTLWGRVWCGYACPQTVFLEGLYRRVERWIEGNRNTRLRRNEQGVNFDWVWRKTLKQIVFVVISLGLSHTFLSYFVSLPAMFAMVQQSPSHHPEAFAWTMIVAGVFYFNFAWFREQMCLIICPYGRLQSVLVDNDTLVIGYDAQRGEPRTKAHAEKGGDCVACNRCVVVCPTGIDIRNGLQLDCIGCAACVDACDEVMTKLGREKGLVRYDSLNGLAGKPKRFWRPRLAFYAFLGVLGLTALTIAIRSHTPFEANLVRMVATPYIVTDTEVRNIFEIHLINKTGSRKRFSFTPVAATDLTYQIEPPVIELGPTESRRIPVFVTAPNVGGQRTRKVRIRLVTQDSQSKSIEGSKELEAAFLAPGS